MGKPGGFLFSYGLMTKQKKVQLAALSVFIIRPYLW